MRVTSQPALWLAVALAALPASVGAQMVQKAPKAEAGKKDIGATLKAYEAGIKSYQAGKFEPAVRSLSAALQAGGLQSQQMAKALLYRGIAYRKQGKPAQAIADLTSAVWLKGGLSDAERSEAMENRTAAFREAGIQDAGGTVATSAGPSATPSTAVATPGAVAATPGTAAGSDQVASKSDTGTPGSTAELPWKTATSPPAGPSPSAASSPSPAAPVLAAAPVEEAPASSSAPGTGSTIAGFFSNLFQGGSSASSGGGETAAISPPQATAPAPAQDPALSSWTSETVSAPARPQRMAAAAPVAAEAITQEPSTAKGKYRLQIAAVRSREEADQLVAKLRSEHGASLGDVAPVIDEAVLGNMGTFYRIQIGPYRTAEQPKQMCQTLRTSGYDCMMVTQ